jgi:hypothetical protein
MSNESYYSLNICVDNTDFNTAPTFKEAMAGPYKTEFLQAIDKEFASLESNSVFSQPCVLPAGMKALDT